jgi:hypothetical protein
MFLKQLFALHVTYWIDGLLAKRFPFLSVDNSCQLVYVLAFDCKISFRPIHAASSVFLKTNFMLVG